MTNLTIKDLTLPEQYVFSDLSNGDFFFNPKDDNHLYMRCPHPHGIGYYALCMDSHSDRFAKIFEFEDDDAVIPICNVELTLL